MKVNKRTNFIQIYVRKDKKKFIADNIPNDCSLSDYMVQATLEKIAVDTGKNLSTD